MRKPLIVLLTLLVALSMVLAACTTPAATEAPTQAPAAVEEEPTDVPAPVEEPTEAEPMEEPTSIPVAESTCTGTPVRWYIGLGAGSNPEEVAKEEVFLKKFNDKYGDTYCLKMDVVTNATAYDVLKTQIASGDVPDIVGPVGVRGLWSFEGAWLDLTDQVEATGFDLADFNPALIDFYKLGPQGQVGLPFAVYPSALFYNKDLFDEAGLEYPPHEFGAPYADGDDWTFDKVRELGMFLTVDENGNDATMAEFDPEKVAQFGFDAQWTDARGRWTFFGPGSFVDEGGTAVLPEVWREAAQWYYDGMWVDHFIPNDNYVNSDYLTQGNTFNSGHVAMNPVNMWYTCCLADVPNWDIAAIPSYNGEITAKLHADTFSILKEAKDPDLSFEVLSLFLGEFAPDLLTVYNGFPARESLQESAITAKQADFPDVDWNVFIEAMNYPDNPNHESGMPNFQKASDRYATFGSLYQSTPDLDLDAEFETLLTDLQGIFDEVK